MTERLTDEHLRRYIQQPLGCDHKEAIQIILALRAHNAKLKAALEDAARQMLPSEMSAEHEEPKLTIEIDLYELEQLIAALDVYARVVRSNLVHDETVALRNWLATKREPPCK